MINTYILISKNAYLTILLTLLATGISTLFPLILLQYLAFLGVLSIGILHGANDLLLIGKVKGHSKFDPKTLAIYLLLVSLVSLLLNFFPFIALCFFVLFSAYHFGEQQWTMSSGSINSWGGTFFYFLYGLMIFATLFYTHVDQVIDIINEISSVKLSSTFFDYLFYFSCFALVLMSIRCYTSISDILRFQLLATFSILLLFYFTPLFWSFAFYFVFWHSLPSLREQLVFLYGNTTSKSYKLYFKNGLFYWILALVGLALSLYVLQDNKTLFLSVFFSFLAAITIPHVWVVILMKKNANRHGN